MMIDSTLSYPVDFLHVDELQPPSKSMNSTRYMETIIKYSFPKILVE